MGNPSQNKINDEHDGDVKYDRIKYQAVNQQYGIFGDSLMDDEDLKDNTVTDEEEDDDDDESKDDVLDLDVYKSAKIKHSRSDVLIEHDGNDGDHDKDPMTKVNEEKHSLKADLALLNQDRNRRD